MSKVHEGEDEENEGRKGRIINKRSKMKEVRKKG